MFFGFCSVPVFWSYGKSSSAWQETLQVEFTTTFEFRKVFSTIVVLSLFMLQIWRVKLRAFNSYAQGQAKGQFFLLLNLVSCLFTSRVTPHWWKLTKTERQWISIELFTLCKLLQFNTGSTVFPTLEHELRLKVVEFYNKKGHYQLFGKKEVVLCRTVKCGGANYCSCDAWLASLRLVDLWYEVQRRQSPSLLTL